MGLGTKNCSLNWIIDSFTSIDTVVNSSVYVVEFEMGGSKIVTQWKFSLHPEICSIYAPQVALSALCYMQVVDIEAKMKCSIVDKRNQVRNMKPCGVQCFNWVNFWNERTTDFIDRETLLDPNEGYLRRDGSLHLCCTIEIVSQKTQNSTREFPADVESRDNFPTFTLKNLWRHFIDGKYCDVTFHVSGREFKLHKVVMSRFPVFAAMFDADMEEGRENYVSITDVDFKIFELLLEYVYTGNVDKLKGEDAAKLIMCADKYCMQGLVEVCENCLCSDLSIENAAEMFRLSHLLRLELLLKCTEQLILNHSEKIAKTAGFKNMNADLLLKFTMTVIDKVAAKNKET